MVKMSGLRWGVTDMIVELNNEPVKQAIVKINRKIQRLRRIMSDTCYSSRIDVAHDEGVIGGLAYARNILEEFLEKYEQTDK